MNLRRKKELDPIFEILGLLFNCFQKSEKKEIIEEFDELGVDGEKFYQKYYKLVDRYVRSFKKHVVLTPKMDFFFRDQDEEFFNLLGFLLLEHREWMESLDGITDDRIRSLIAFAVKDHGDSIVSMDQAEMPKLHDEKEVIGFLMGLDKEESFKWHLLELMQTPKAWISQLIEIVKHTIPAYEKALEEIKKPLEPLIIRYEKYESQQFAKLVQTCAPGSVVYPTLIAGCAQIIFCTQVYEGIFLEYLLKKGKVGDERKELLVLRLKALGDRSKLDILCALKVSSKYNLELAETLNLSASTMSHHMNVLFACGFVGVDKKDGKVYYYLQREAVTEFTDDLRYQLL